MSKALNTSGDSLSKPFSSRTIAAFRKRVLDHYEQHGRDLPWRKKIDPYRVLVSEIMLQQTQVERVIDKYREFLEAFPDFSSLAKAPLPELLRIWQGMGYNRRALSLRQLAQEVMAVHQGRLPQDPEVLLSLPGIGKYTAGAVAAFAFNKRVVFMDTNIRRVFIHEFFPGREEVRDEELFPIVEQALDTVDPRTWYNALMDYGTMLKKEHGNPNTRSAHYTRQSTFENSNRQVRGRILKLLIAESPLGIVQVVKQSGMDAERVKKNLAQLAEEGFIRNKGKAYYI